MKSTSVRTFLLVFACFISGAVSADDYLSAAFKACLNQRVSGSQISINKLPVDGTAETTLGIVCIDTAATALFDSIARYSTESQSVWSSGSLVVTRNFGKLHMPSQCNREIRDPQGYAISRFWCIVQLDVGSSVIQALNL